MINLSLNELKLIAKSSSIKYYKNKSKEHLTKTLSESKLEKSPHNLQKYYDYDDTEYQFVASNEQFANNE